MPLMTSNQCDILFNRILIDGQLFLDAEEASECLFINQFYYDIWNKMISHVNVVISKIVDDLHNG